LYQRLKREGVKTHKERVEELNKYLSNMSEHHDMYVLLPSPFPPLFNARELVAATINGAMLLTCTSYSNRPKIGPG
ncbi:hypothetical protein KEM55_005301, partial [Ascosphaera atra]